MEEQTINVQMEHERFNAYYSIAVFLEKKNDNRQSAARKKKLKSRAALCAVGKLAISTAIEHGVFGTAVALRVLGCL